jgi:hypothetical protein
VFTHWVLPQLVYEAPPSLPRVCAPGKARITPGKAQITPGKAWIPPGKTQIVPGKARILPGKAQITPVKANSAKEVCGAVPAFGRDLPAQLADLRVVTGLALSAVILRPCADAPAPVLGGSASQYSAARR